MKTNIRIYIHVCVILVAHKNTHIYMYVQTYAYIHVRIYITKQSPASDILADCIGLPQTSVYRAKHPPERQKFYQIHVIISCKGYYSCHTHI